MKLQKIFYEKSAYGSNCSFCALLRHLSPKNDKIYCSTWNECTKWKLKIRNVLKLWGIFKISLSFGQPIFSNRWHSSYHVSYQWLLSINFVSINEISDLKILQLVLSFSLISRLCFNQRLFDLKSFWESVFVDVSNWNSLFTS